MKEVVAYRRIWSSTYSRSSPVVSARQVVFVSAVRVDGSPMDGVWRATLADPVGLGAAEFAVTVTDNAGNRQGYWGPWLMDWLDPISNLMRPIPDGAGPFDIVS